MYRLGIAVNKIKLYTNYLKTIFFKTMDSAKLITSTLPFFLHKNDFLIMIISDFRFKSFKVSLKKKTHAMLERNFVARGGRKISKIKNSPTFCLLKKLFSLEMDVLICIIHITIHMLLPTRMSQNINISIGVSVNNLPGPVELPDRLREEYYLIF